LNLRQFYPYILLFLVSCNPPHEKESVDFSLPTIVEAKGYIVPSDSLKVPQTTPTHLRMVQAKKPEMRETGTNVQSIEKPRQVKIINPTICTIGQGSYTTPKTVALTPQTKKAGVPAVLRAKEATNKDHNPDNFSSFGILQGLIDNQVTCIIQDKNSNLWLGTPNGVSKYDGQNFTQFTVKEGLCSNDIAYMLEDSKGNIWFATSGGASKYDGKTFTNFTENEGLCSNFVLSICEDKKGQIWLGTEGAPLSKLNQDKNTFTHYNEQNGLSSNVVWHIFEDKKGNLWFGTLGGGVSCLNKDETFFTHITEKDGLLENNVFKILEDRAGNMWLGTGKGISLYDGKQLTQFTENEGLSNNVIFSILEDQFGNIWFGTATGGVSRMSQDRKTFTHFSEKEGLSNNIIRSLWEDKNGTIWIGTQGDGVAKYNGNVFTHMTQNEGLSNNTVKSILGDKSGNIWLGTWQGGVSKLDNNGRLFSYFTENEGLSNNRIHCIAEDKNDNIWFGTDAGGACQLDKNGKQFAYLTEKEGLKSNEIRSILADKSGNIWLGTWSQGVSKYSPRQSGREGTITHYSEAEGLLGTIVNDILEDKKGNIWFGTEKGATCMNPENSSFTHFGKPEGLINPTVNCLFEDKSGNIWLGTEGGVTIYNGTHFLHLADNNGLTGKNVLSIVEDMTGNIWLGSSSGLNKVSPTGLLNITKPFNELRNTYDSHRKTTKSNPTDSSQKSGWQNYTYEDGLSGIACYSIFESNSGKIWLASNNRVTVYYPRNDQINKTPPNTQLTKITLFNESISWVKDSVFTLGNGVKAGDFMFDDLSEWYNIPQNLSLPHYDNYLTFHFVGISINSPQKVRYQYKLEGLEKNWSAVSNISEATFGNLPHGSYIFKVKSMNGEGTWSDEVHYPFVIRPPWWKTWWARLLYVCLGIGLLYSLIQYRISQGLMKVKALEAIRIKISSDLHDEVGSILSGLAMQSEMIALTSNIKDKSSLTEISAMSHDAMERMRDTVWAIDSRKDKFENLIDRMRFFAEKNLNMKGVNHDFVVKDVEMRRFIDPEKRQNVYLIFKEAITNIMRHSDASHVQIEFLQEKNKLSLIIHDNGSAKETTQSDGLGLNNMKTRAMRIGGTLRVQYAQGYLVELTFNTGYF
jgi:ligand-binding sensor domain-containing protein/two-component sensor histidine kinase